ncbi:serine protease, partial [Bacillus sp. JR_15]
MTHHKNEQQPSQELQTTEQPQKRKKKPNGWFKPFVSGVVGGTLALGVYVLSPYAQHASDNTAHNSAVVSTNDTSANSSKTTAVQTSHSSSSISSMVENVSPAIVGITNYQAQSQTDTSFG